MKGNEELLIAELAKQPHLRTYRAPRLTYYQVGSAADTAPLPLPTRLNTEVYEIDLHPIRLVSGGVMVVALHVPRSQDGFTAPYILGHYQVPPQMIYDLPRDPKKAEAIADRVRAEVTHDFHRELDRREEEAARWRR